MCKTKWTLIQLFFLIFLCCNKSVLSKRNSVVDSQLYEGSQCQLADGGGQGICVKASACPTRLKEIREGNYSTVNRCGFQNFTEITCCASGKVVTEKFRNRLRQAEMACQSHKKTLEENNVEGYLYSTVINGVRAKKGEFPSMAALGYPASKEEAPGGIKYICGGTLISKKHVLTAAHCVSNVQGFVPVEVMLGTTDIDTPDAESTQRIPISRIIKHPEHKQSLNYHDVAILELKNPINFTADVYPTCLMTKPLNADSSFVVLGWGAISLDGTTSTKLLKADHLNLVSKNKCDNSYKNVRAQIPEGLDDGMICVSDPDTTRNADTCWGDSGGPLLISSPSFPLLAGVTSFGQACGGSTPAVYASVYKYLDWIEDQVWPNFV